MKRWQELGGEGPGLEQRIGRPSRSARGLLLLLLLALVVGAAGAEATGLRFVDGAADAGLTDPTWCGRPEKPHLKEQDGSGLALVDYDGDGDLDLYLVNGWRLEGSEVREQGPDRLYRNRGDGRFDDVSAAAGVGSTGWGAGVAVGDLQGDGDPDLFVTQFGPDLLLINRGDGSFEEAGEPPGIDGWSSGAVFFDPDADGDLDLFVAAYIEATLEELLHAEPTLEWNGLMVMLGPFGLEGLANHYFENLGGATFREATAKAGLKDAGLFFSLGAAALDLDGDRDLDLYVANDSNPNYFFVNDGTGHFGEEGLWSGAALDHAGLAQAGMGIAAGDVDGDGDTDLFLTNFALDASTLYQNLGDGVYADVSREWGVAEPTYSRLSWGTTLSDFDLDGDLDLFVADGHIYPQADLLGDPDLTYAQPNLLMENVGARFADVSSEAGPGLAVVESSRGVAVGDVDQDGDLDLAISNVDAPPTLLLNQSSRAGAWALVSAPGAARLTVEIGSRSVVREFVAGASYLSSGDPSFHFGLGPSERIDRLDVEWLDGRRTVFRRLPADRKIVLPAPPAGARPSSMGPRPVP